jgi:hypothetical protein
MVCYRRAWVVGVRAPGVAVFPSIAAVRSPSVRVRARFAPLRRTVSVRCVRSAKGRLLFLIGG